MKYKILMIKKSKKIMNQNKFNNNNNKWKTNKVKRIK